MVNEPEQCMCGDPECHKCYPRYEYDERDPDEWHDYGRFDEE